MFDAPPLLLGDRIRKESAEAISRLREQGVENIVLLTGDNSCAAASVAKRLNIDTYYAELLPEDKVVVDANDYRLTVLTDNSQKGVADNFSTGVVYPNLWYQWMGPLGFVTLAMVPVHKNTTKL